MSGCADESIVIAALICSDLIAALICSDLRNMLTQSRLSVRVIPRYLVDRTCCGI